MVMSILYFFINMGLLAVGLAVVSVLVAAVVAIAVFSAICVFEGLTDYFREDTNE